MTEFEKWHNMIDAYEKILHPDLFLPIKKQLHEVYKEAKEQAFKSANISAEAREIENEIKRIKEGIKANGHVMGHNAFVVRCFYKWLLKRFNV